MRERLLTMWARVRATLFSRAMRDAELEEEFAFHLEKLVERNRARGMSEAEARRVARLTFGGTERFREDVWDVERSRWLEDFWQDAKHAVRLLRRTPAFSFAAILTLALGIGANTAIFSVVDAVLLRPLPYAEPGELVSFHAQYDNYRAWTEASRVLESAGTYTYSLGNVTAGREPVRVWTLAATSSLLPTLGVAPLLGRNFSATDDVHPSPPRVMLRHGFWQTQFGGRRDIVGRTIDVNGVPHEVIGVLPRDFEFPPPIRLENGTVPLVPDLWTGAGWVPDFAQRGALAIIGRLQDGFTPLQLSSELESIANANRAGPERVRVPVSAVAEAVVAPLRPAMVAFTAAIALVLLVACANLGSMLLARFTTRGREIAIRRSLGAPRGRILRQVLAEGVVLGLAGSLAGLLVAWLLLQLLLVYAPVELPRVHQATLNARVLLVALTLGALSATLITLLPAWSANRRDPRSALGTRGSGADTRTVRAQSALVAAEVALAVVLLVAGGLLLRSFVALTRVDPGFAAGTLVTADVLIPSDRYADRNATLHFFDALEQRLGAQPGVTSVSAIDRLPYGPSSSQTGFTIVGRSVADEKQHPRGWNTAARPGYFRTMRIPLVYGREFTSADREDAAPVVVLSRALADRYWPGRSPVGERVVVWGVEREIVGVAADVRHFGPTQPVDPIIYLPQAQDVTTRRMMTIVVQTSSDRDRMLSVVRDEIRALDAQLPVSNLRSFESLQTERTANQRFQALLVGSFAALGLLLAAVGIYGVMSYIVAQRTREIGVRVALGASRSTVVRHFLSRALRIVVIGAVIGLACAVPLTRFLQSMLFGVPLLDRITYAGVIVLTGALALIAAWLPAFRAARVQPVVALRAE